MSEQKAIPLLGVPLGQVEARATLVLDAELAAFGQRFLAEGLGPVSVAPVGTATSTSAD